MFIQNRYLIFENISDVESNFCDYSYENNFEFESENDVRNRIFISLFFFLEFECYFDVDNVLDVVGDLFKWVIQSGCFCFLLNDFLIVLRKYGFCVF